MKLTSYQVDDLRHMMKECGLSPVLRAVSDIMRTVDIDATTTNTGETTPIKPDIEGVIRNILLDTATIIDD